MTPQERARKLRPYIEKAAESLSDDDALAAPELFEHYEVDHFYKKDERFLWAENGKLYKVLQDHTSAAQWRPDEAVSLYVEVTPPGEIPVWKQPTGAQDAYMTGDKVHYPTKEDPVYVSIVDNNVWAPDVYGWELVP